VKLQRLDDLDSQNFFARWRDGRLPTVFSNRSPTLSERAWIEANGYT
jgi:hypothetical protein